MATTVETGRKPTLKDLRRIITRPPRPSGEFSLTPSVDVAIKPTSFYEDSDVALKDQASEAFSDELRAYPEHRTKTSRLKFIKSALKFSDYRIAQFLGITTDQVVREDLRGRRIAEVERFTDRFNGLYVIASLLERHSSGYVGAVMDRRVALEVPNGVLSDVSIGAAMRDGFANVAVAVAQMTVRQEQESIGYQRGIEIPTT